MSLITQMLIVEKYGLRLDIEHLAQVLSLTPASIRNQLSVGTFPIPTYKESGKRWADYRDVADYVDRCHAEASRTSAECKSSGLSCV